MRVVKEAEERRNEILDAAEELFGTKGFDNTSTGEILEKVGIARGTLYYHFKSKEDILDAMTDRLLARLLAGAAAISEDKSLTVFERMSKTVMSLNIDTPIANVVMEQIHRPQNALMHQKIQKGLIKGVCPIMTKLAEEGIEQGVIHTCFPAETIEMIMVYSNYAFDELLEQTEEQRQNRIMGFIHNVEKLLGTEQGAMQKAIMEIFRAQNKNGK